MCWTYLNHQSRPTKSNWKCRRCCWMSMRSQRCRCCRHRRPRSHRRSRRQNRHQNRPSRRSRQERRHHRLHKERAQAKEWEASRRWQPSPRLACKSSWSLCAPPCGRASLYELASYVRFCGPCASSSPPCRRALAVHPRPASRRHRSTRHRKCRHKVSLKPCVLT